MFTINDDLSIYATRGDTVFFTVTADENGAPYTFQAGDVLRIKIFEKKNAENVVLEKCFPVTAATDQFTILLTEEDTKIGEVISKAKDYWYEIELNPFTNPQTIIGYDEDGAKIFKLFPEGADSEIPEVKPEDIPVVDVELDMTSNRPVQNQAISRAIVNLADAYKYTENKTNVSLERFSEDVCIERARIDNLLAGGTASDSEVVDIRVGVDGVTYSSAGSAVREQIKNLRRAIQKSGLYGDTRYTLPEDDGDKKAEEIGFLDLSGNFVSTDTWRTTEYVDISHAAVITCNLMGFNTMCSIAFYDEGEVFVSGVSVAENFDRITGNVIVPNKAKYARFAFLTQQEEQFVRVETMRECTDFLDDAFNGKTITATGDSITDGSASVNGMNYVKMIADNHSMNYENKAIWGAVIPAGIKSNGAELPSILGTVETMRADADFVILSGGVNDFCHIYDGNEPFGEVTVGFGADLDETTYCGAFESLLKRAILKWSGKKILFVIEHKMIGVTSAIGMQIESLYLPKTIEMLEKWGIPYVDLYHELPPIGLIDELRDAYTWDNDNDGIGDGWHPTVEGYRVFYMPKVEGKLKAL